MQPAVLVLTFLVGILAFYYKTIYDVVRNRLRLYKAMWKFGGPYTLPLIGSLHHVNIFDVSQLTARLMQLGLDYCAKGHGLIQIWVGPVPMLAVIDPKYAKEVLESNDVITKADEYDILFPWLGTGLLTSTGSKWRQRRKMLTPAFHFKVLNDFLKVHDYQAKVFLEELKVHADTDVEIDIFPYIKRMALDIICETSMGSTVDAQHNHDHSYVT
uniref:Cytochrome P450 n=1 Tax=Caenorhabditis japonica TaxID=281687 RepID=A0A8R1J362_CAEJA